MFTHGRFQRIFVAILWVSVLFSNTAKANGKYYETTVPDTLDLARRADIAINGLAGTLDEKCNYEIWFRTSFTTNPPFMHHDTTGLPTNNPKYAESFPMMRIMSGNQEYLDAQKGMMNMILSYIAEDGLYYSPCRESRPWHESVGHKSEVPSHEDFANVYGNARLLLAFMAWMQYNPDGPWQEKADGIAKALTRIAIKKGNYAYYPDSRVGEAFSYPKSGWKNTDEPAGEATGAEGSMFMYYCGPIRALSRWYRMTGDSEALETAKCLVTFVTKKKFWGLAGLPTDIDTEDRGYFSGHMHGHTAMLYALVEYATTVNDPELLNFVRESYEFARHHGIPRMGVCLNSQPDVEVCTISDMIATAIKLTDSGIGNYYEDVDQMVRNQLVESQLLRADYLKAISQAHPSHQATPPQQTSKNVIERNIGVLVPMQLNGYPTPYGINCCNGNGTQALYYVWSKVIEFDEASSQAKINFLLNRASKWMDIDSYLPFEGRIVLKNKKVKTLFVRIPSWVNKNKLSVTIGKEKPAFSWIGNYIFIKNIKPKNTITILFPMKGDTAEYDFHGSTLTCQFKGNTLVDIEPKVSMPAYPIYERSRYKKDKTPTEKVKRYVSDTILKW